MERKVNKLISVILTLTLVMSVLIPVSADRAKATETYDLWVGGVQVTSDNAADVLGEADGEKATVIYNPATNTLTLDGAQIDKTYERMYVAAGISSGGDIDIELKGENTITVSGGTVASAGIYAEGVITINGEGSLHAKASHDSSEVRVIATGYTSKEAGIIINGGSIESEASGGSTAYAIYIDKSYDASTGLQDRFFKINGGSAELDAITDPVYNSYATNIKPDLSGYENYAATAVNNGSLNNTVQAYDENSWQYYRYIKVQALEYDENGISQDGQHYQPAKMAEDGYYEISNAGNLFWFAEKLEESEDNATLNARLINDITMPEDKNWVAFQVGTYGAPYNGIFDGCGYTITGLNVKSDNASYVFNNEGLFKTIGNDGAVKNLGVVNADVNPDSGYAGAICGANYGLIENCYSENSNIVSGVYSYAGGIAGRNYGVISRCYNTGTVLSDNSYSAGGIAGYSGDGSQINNCYNTGEISAMYYSGGICGELQNGTVSNCYNLGKAKYSNIAVSYNNGGTVENTYYLNLTDNGSGGKTDKQFASGEVAYLLNGSTSEGNLVWGQNVSGEDAQNAPVLGGAIVYAGYEACNSVAITYSNDADSLSATKPEHIYSTEWTCDDDYHWHKCSNTSCNAIANKAAHNSDGLINAVEATASKEGYTGDKTCTVCGRVMEKGTVINKTAPTVISGAEGEFSHGTDAGGLSFTSDAASDDFKNVIVDGAVIDSSDYTVTGDESSLTITLDAEYLNSLSYGKHSIAIVSESGSAETTFNINDIAAPEIDIMIEENSIKTAINEISFGLFFNRNIDVEITATDDLSGVSAIEYYISPEVLNENDLEDVQWINSEETEKLIIAETAEDAKQLIYYVKVTDKAGNTTCTASNGVVFDLTSPQIEGIKNNYTYYTTQMAIISDKNLLDEQQKELIIRGNVDKEYTVAVQDKAGNETVYVINMKPISDLVKQIDGITLTNVKSVNENDIAEIKEKVNGIIREESANATYEELAELNDIIDRCNSLQNRINQVEEAVYTEAVKKTEEITANNVSLKNKDILESALNDLQTALENNAGNYTEDEILNIETDIDRIEKALEAIHNSENVSEVIKNLPDNIVISDEKAISAAKKAYDDLTANEKAMVGSELKNKLDTALAELDKIKEKTDSVKTGDETNPADLIVLLLLSFSALACFAYEQRRKYV